MSHLLETLYRIHDGYDFVLVDMNNDKTAVRIRKYDAHDDEDAMLEIPVGQAQDFVYAVQQVAETLRALGDV